MVKQIPQGYKQTKVGIIPNEWKVEKIHKIFKKLSFPVEVCPESLYQEIGIRSHGKGIFYKEKVSGQDLGNKSVFWIHPNCLILNIVFAWEQAIAKTAENEIGFIASHRFPMYKPDQERAALDFYLYFFKSKRGKLSLELASPGGAGRNKTLGQLEFAKLDVPLPPKKEQDKIAEILSTWDDAITKQAQLIEQRQVFKKGIMQQVFSQELRFKGDNSNDYPAWDYLELSDLLTYKQPTKYLVSSKDYCDDYKIPVLTAGKSFILGYTNETSGIFRENLPVIIFDDFTTSNQFVNFKFKVKSSAMKILLPATDKVNIRYIYERMQFIDFALGDEHKRYWISEYSREVIEVPSSEEQNKIADFLTSFDDEITKQTEILEQLKLQKQSLMQKLLTGQVRVKI